MCMYIYIYVYIYINMYTYIYIHIHVLYINDWIYPPIGPSIYRSIYGSTDLWTYRSIDIWIYRSAVYICLSISYLSFHLYIYLPPRARLVRSVVSWITG